MILIGSLMALLAFEFWAGSRYPALNEKLMMGVATPLAGLAFSPLLAVAPDETVLRRILFETINWVYTNRQGMTFGVLFGAALMTLLGQLQRRAFRSRFGNTLAGLLIGAPLGVCVNCAAPIAKGMRSAGARVETMLAAMVSSPTLNVIVLTMLFSLFPVYIAVIKIGLTLVFILVAIPLLTRFLPGTALTGAGLDAGLARLDKPAALPTVGEDPKPGPLADGDSTWSAALRWLVKTFASNLWFICKTTLPLMLLAGFLGAVLITLLPLEAMADLLPTEGRKRIALALFGLALLGVFLPVPMSFDVIATAVLWQAGLPTQYAVALLLTLGAFSIFSFFIVWQSISLRMAASLFLALAGLGVAGGIAARGYQDWDNERQERLFFDVFSRSTASLQGPKVTQIGGETRQEMSADELLTQLQSGAMLPQQWLAGQDGISVQRIALQAPSATGQALPQGGKLFTRLEGKQIGLDEPHMFSVRTFHQPSILFRGIASGDVHNDGWADILLTSESGLSLYANRQGKGFVQQRIDIAALKGFHVVNAALVDLNNDGWLDIFFSTWRHGNFVIYNSKGVFAGSGLHKLPDVGAQPAMAGAAAFGDLYQDGRLDIVLGNWQPPCRAFMPCQDRPSNNFVLRNTGGQFKPEQPFPDVPGRQTLNLLLSDINNDGKLDLIIGNEGPEPDFFFLGDAQGGFRPIVRAQGLIPHTTSSTMSIASADVNNDLLPEIYLGQITEITEKSKHLSRPTGAQTCQEIMDAGQRSKCEQVMQMHQILPSQVNKRNVFSCLSSDANDFREDCIAHSLLLKAIQDGPQDQCELFQDRWEAFRHICRQAYREAPEPEGGNPRRNKLYGPHRAGWAETIPVIHNHNVLLTPVADGRFADVAGDMGVKIAGFTWSARFADLNNDGFVDLYAVNGWLSERTQQSHLFFQNQQGKRFVDMTQEAGLTSFLATSSYTYVDIDNDGDLDIVAVPVVGPVLVYLNNSTSNRVAFELRDQIGNQFGIGSKITIHYGPGGARHQMREMQASGGFISFDAPITYFGLGEHRQIERVEVRWSTGERSEIRGDFQAGARYVINRASTAANTRR